MTLTNHHRAHNAAPRQSPTTLATIATRTFVDLLADAMHWCHRNNHEFSEAFDTTSIHFDAETAEEDWL